MTKITVVFEVPTKVQPKLLEIYYRQNVHALFLQQRQSNAVNKYKTILKLHNTDCLHELLSQTLFVSLISEFG